MKARSDAAAAILETIEDLHEIGLVDQDTLHGFILRCQQPESVNAADTGYAFKCQSEHGSKVSQDLV